MVKLAVRAPEVDGRYVPAFTQSSSPATDAVSAACSAPGPAYASAQLVPVPAPVASVAST